MRSGLTEFTSARRVGIALLHVAHQVEGLIEVALDLDDARAVHHRLRQLAERDLALRHDDEGADAGARRVRRRRRRRVARRRADDRLGALGERPRDRDRHAAVLERPGRVLALALEPDLDARRDRRRQPVGAHERRVALVQRDDPVVGADGQVVAILLDQPAPAVRRRSRQLLLDADRHRPAAHRRPCGRSPPAPARGSARVPGASG